MSEKLSFYILSLIAQASTDMPPDVVNEIKAASKREEAGSTAQSILQSILKNVDLARRFQTPICQDTGTLIFYVDVPTGTNFNDIKNSIHIAVETATKSYLLRPNAVNPLTGANTGNNIGINSPYIHFSQWDKDEFQIRLMLKGGGSENVGVQYTLPDEVLDAERDINGIKKCILYAAFNAQGKGCAPGIVGVGIGGDRTTSYMLSKEMLFRTIGERSQDPTLAQIEVELYEVINNLEIGPMGLGGKTTVLDVFCGAQHRHPACFFVSVSYMCWACRRGTLLLTKEDFSYD